MLLTFTLPKEATSFYGASDTSFDTGIDSFMISQHPYLCLNWMDNILPKFIQIVMNLLDALKTSFSHRSLTARSMGKRDSVSDATVAGLSLLKGYVRTYRNADDKCMQRYICEANTECVREIGGASIFCQLGSYATSYFLDRTSDGHFEQLYDAGRRGRSGYDCQQLFLECNEV
ncbi:PREDICTED: uncharacterized protein LOC108363523 [Rhagoletis zephyria]|uniref:uncharacterized protein LOC108363523 n=1 Tax=Rhagoletis zephyria TaxID=28612 RepID=UPI0008118F79|nr:PREDICTED: uncharacterized protein LOC108363523 [Rhagoletis zephyria]